jgi:alpha,alpha-trehalase
MYPAGWPSSHLIAVEGLDAYGFRTEAERIGGRFLGVIVEQYDKTGKLWEKYNVVDGGITLPNSRYGTVPYVGWTAAAVVLLGRRLFEGTSLSVL